MEKLKLSACVLLVTAGACLSPILAEDPASVAGGETDLPPIEEGFAEVNGANLYYKTMGSGEPIVVLHGGPGFDHRQFLPHIWELASRYKVILYDQRATGLSSGTVDADSVSVDAFVDDIEGIRKAFKIEKMNLLGHSWGGILAMHYSLRHQDKLKTLILCSTAASVESFPLMRKNYEANRLAEDKKLLQEIASSDPFKAKEPEAIERFWRVFFKPYFVDPAQVDRMDLHFTANTISNGDAVAGHIIRSLGEFDLHEELKSIRIPTLVIHGDSDPMPSSFAQRIHESIEDSTLVIAEDSGHWLFVDATETFRNSIFDFLGRNSLLEADREFAKNVSHRGVDAWVEWFGKEGVQIVPGQVLKGVAIREAMTPVFAAEASALSWDPDHAVISKSGDLGYTYGRFESKRLNPAGEIVTGKGRYVTIWKMNAHGEWKVSLDTGVPDPGDS